MLGGVGRVLRPGGRFIVYGPFTLDGVYTSPGDESFDAALRSGGAAQGLRDRTMLERSAARHHLFPQRVVPMPVNNFILLFERRTQDHA